MPDSPLLFLPTLSLPVDETRDLMSRLVTTRDRFAATDGDAHLAQERMELYGVESLILGFLVDGYEEGKLPLEPVSIRDRISRARCSEVEDSVFRAAWLDVHQMIASWLPPAVQAA